MIGTAALASSAQASSYNKEATLQYGSDYQHSSYDYQLAAFAKGIGAGTEVDSYNETGTYEDNVWYANSQDELRMEGWMVSGGYKDKYKYNGSFAYYDTAENTDLRITDGNPDTTRSWTLRVEGEGDYTVHFYSDYEPQKGELADSGDTVGTVSDGNTYVGGSVTSGDPDTFRVYGDVRDVLPSNVGDYLRVEYTNGTIHEGHEV